MAGMKRLWLLFAQVVTVLLAAWFVVLTLKPQWLGRAGPMGGSLGTISILQAPETPVGASAPGSLNAAVRRAAPAVVSINTSTTTHNPAANDPWFRFFFGDRGAEQQQNGLGSGVIMSPEGYILTNNHVVEGAERLRVRLHDEREFTATVVGTDPKTDLAVIRIDAPRLVPAVVSSSERVRVGKSVTVGIVSAVGRGGMGITDYGDFIQTDAAINQGNSGGPLIDLQGRLIGINTAIASQSGGSNGVGFAIPIDLAKVVMAQLIEHGSVERGWLGIVMGKLDERLAGSFGLRGHDGVLVDDVDGKGPAAKAGLVPGDIITALDGKSVRDMVALRNGVAQRRPGTKVELTVFRDGKTRTVALELAALPGQGDGAKRKKSARPGKPKVAPPPELGLQLVDPSDEVRTRWRLDVRKGAVVAGVAPDSLASDEIEPGDVIVEVGDQAVRSASQAESLLDKADLERGVRLRIRRGDLGHYVLLHRDR
jgi:Do/DeqQ family serine protease